MNVLVSHLRECYLNGTLTPDTLLDTLYAKIHDDDPKIWIRLLSREEAGAYAARLRGRSIEELPLYGIPFAIKDNIDLAGIPTTAACPDYAYTPARSAYVVEKLIEAGAIPLGKTNLDQFATGLVGVRSPYGIPSNAFDPRYIPGGSSSGSAVAVAKGLVSFALGTDTAGSGRVPASLNNIVGWKPSRGLLSTTGLVPACRSLDCISVFSLTCDDARSVLDIVAGFDVSDSYSADLDIKETVAKGIIGVPQFNQLEFFGDRYTQTIFYEAIRLLKTLGYEVVEIDFEPFKECAELLYEGPWLAERFIVLEDILKERPDILHPVTREIVSQGNRRSAVDYFRTLYRLQALRRKAETIMASLDAIMTPTCATVYTLEQVLKDPITLNSQLGYYTNFMNLLDLSAVAVPAGIRPDRIPHGVTFFAPAKRDLDLLRLGGIFHPLTGLNIGTTDEPVPAPTASVIQRDMVPLVVCGAHMRDMPLNHELLERGASFITQTTTAPEYRLFALHGQVSRPALVKNNKDGAAIEVEMWQMPTEAFGSFLQGIAAPLGLGYVTLADDSEVIGFIAEASAQDSSVEITEFKSWRAYQNSLV